MFMNDGNKAAYEKAWNNANAVPGRTLADQVERALHRSYSVDALREIRDALLALGGGKMAVRFWRLAGNYLNEAEDQKAAFVAEVKALDPKPAPQPVLVASGPVADVSQTELSDHLARTFGISKQDVPS